MKVIQGVNKKNSNYIKKARLSYYVSLSIVALSVFPRMVYADEYALGQISLNTSSSIWGNNPTISPLEWSQRWDWRGDVNNKFLSSYLLDLTLKTRNYYGFGVNASMGTGTANANVTFTPTLNGFTNDMKVELGNAFQLNGSLNGFSNELITNLSPISLGVEANISSDTWVYVNALGSSFDENVSITPTVTTNGWQDVLSIKKFSGNWAGAAGSSVDLKLENLSSSKTSASEVVTSAANLRVLEGTLDIDGLATTALKLPPLEGSYRSSFVDFDYNILDLDFQSSLDLKQSFSLNSSIDTTLTFNRDVVIDGQITNSWNGNWDQLPGINLLDLNPVEVTPIFNLDATLANNTRLDFGLDFRTRGPLVGVNFGNIGGLYNPDPIWVGPLWDNYINIPDVPNINIFNETVNLGTVQKSGSIFTLQATTAGINPTGDSLANTLIGDKDGNTISGLGGNDVLIGHGGDDILNGGDGDDLLSGGAGNDILNGGEGVDTVSYRLEGGNDFTSESFTHLGTIDGVHVSLIHQSTGIHETGAGKDTLIDIENVVGSHFTDVLEGDQSSNRIEGLAGNDAIYGRGGDDVLLGGIGNDLLHGDEGNDLLIGGQGHDELDGGTGNDTASYEQTAQSSSNIRGGKLHGVNGELTVNSDGVFVALNQAGISQVTGDGNDTLSNIENLIGSQFNDALIGDEGVNELSGRGGHDHILGGGGNDHLYGEYGNDLLEGQAGNDQLFGGEGNDLLIGGIGDDVLDGGEGIDTVSYKDAGGIALSSDFTHIEGINGVHVSLYHHNTGQHETGAGKDTLINIENIIGSQFSDVLEGDYNSNQIQGLSGNDKIYGRGGNDSLEGGAGNDELFGGTGNDSLNGGSGDDFYLWDNQYANQDKVVDSSGIDSLQYVSDANSADIIVTAVNQSNLAIQLNNNNEVIVENQYGGTGIAIESLASGSGTQNFNLNMSFEQLVGSGQFNNYGIEGEFTTGESITNVNNLQVASQLKNQHIVTNQGELNIGAVGNIDNTSGTLDNQTNGELNFAGSSSLAGVIINNGLINIADDQVLTLVGELSGSGTFVGDTLLAGASVNPGNSPGTLTFDGDTTWDNVDLTMEVARTVSGDLNFDTINILGDLTLLSAFTINFDFLDGLDVSSLLGENFNFLSIGGNVLDKDDNAINLADWAITLVDGWLSNWSQGSDDSWQLALSYDGIGSPTAVPEPSSLLLVLLAGSGLLYQRKKLTKQVDLIEVVSDSNVS